MKILAFVISFLPFNSFRIFFYRNLFGYKIYNSKIGWGTVLFVESVEIIDSWIGRKNQFLGPMKLVIKRKASIGNSNVFECGDWTKSNKYKKANYKRYFEMGENTRISMNNFFDVAGSIIIGKKSQIAGRGSQFWTHGLGVIERDIEIGKNCYVGSSVLFSPGSSIGNNVVVSLGSVVTKREFKDNILIGGQPAKVLKEQYSW